MSNRLAFVAVVFLALMSVLVDFTTYFLSMLADGVFAGLIVGIAYAVLWKR